MSQTHVAADPGLTKLVSNAVRELTANPTPSAIDKWRAELSQVGLAAVADLAQSLRQAQAGWQCLLHEQDDVLINECSLCGLRILEGSIYFKRGAHQLACRDCIDDALRVAAGWQPSRSRTLQWLANLEGESL